MFSLIAVVCQGLSCITFTPPKVYSSAEECMSSGLGLYNVVKDDPSKNILDMTCYNWQDKT